MIAALTAVAVLAALAAPAHAYQTTQKCVPTSASPSVTVRAGDPETSAVPFTVEVRHLTAMQSVTVNVRVDYNGIPSYHTTVAVPTGTDVKTRGQ